MASAKLNVVIKSATEKFKDLIITYDEDWGVEELKKCISKDHLMHPHPSQQKLIYQGKLIQNTDTLTHFLKQMSGETIYLVCPEIEKNSTLNTTSPVLDETTSNMTLRHRNIEQHSTTKESSNKYNNTLQSSDLSTSSLSHHALNSPFNASLPSSYGAEFNASSMTNGLNVAAFNLSSSTFNQSEGTSNIAKFSLNNNAVASSNSNIHFPAVNPPSYMDSSLWHSGGMSAVGNNEWSRYMQTPNNISNASSGTVGSIVGSNIWGADWSNNWWGKGIETHRMEGTETMNNIEKENNQSQGIQDLLNSNLYNPIYMNQFDNNYNMNQYNLWVMQQAYMQYIQQYYQWLEKSHQDARLVRDETPAVDAAVEGVEGAGGRGIHMNVQGGVVDEDDEMADRDWLDWFYVVVRFSLLISICYYYSTPTRFLFIACVAIVLYLHQAGWFKVQRNRVGNNQAVIQPDNQAENQPDILPNNDLVEENPERLVEEDEGEANADAYLPHLRESFNIVTTMLVSFFTSLAPQAPQPINAN